MSRLTIFIPGIMGSRLRQSGGGLLWHEDIYATLSQLVSHPSLMQWSSQSQVIPDGVLEEVEFMGRKQSLCGLLRREMHNMHSRCQLVYDEFAYDWRQDIAVS